MSENLMAALMLCFALVVVAVVWGLGYALVVDNKCVSHGFPQSTLTLSGFYCIKRQDQTDLVVRADSL